jgi:hypothetical protein
VLLLLCGAGSRLILSVRLCLTMRIRKVAILSLLLCTTGCSSPEAPPDVAHALETYAPGLRLGARARDVGQPYELRVAPYVGYADSTYRHASGLGDLHIRVDETLANESQRPSRGARIRSAMLSTAEPQVARRVEADLRARLGNPTEWCFQAEPDQSYRFLYWERTPHSGVMLSIPRGSWGYTRAMPDGVQRIQAHARLTFGTEPPDPAVLRSRPCAQESPA